MVLLLCKKKKAYTGAHRPAPTTTLFHCQRQLKKIRRRLNGIVWADTLPYIGESAGWASEAVFRAEAVARTRVFGGQVLGASWDGQPFNTHTTPVLTTGGYYQQGHKTQCVYWLFICFHSFAFNFYCILFLYLTTLVSDQFLNLHSTTTICEIDFTQNPAFSECR